MLSALDEKVKGLRGGFICTAWWSHCPSLFFSDSFFSCSVSLGHLSVTRYIEQLLSSKIESDGVIGAGIDGQEEMCQDRLGGRFNGTSNLSSITVITFLTLLPKGTTGSDLSDYP